MNLDELFQEQERIKEVLAKAQKDIEKSPEGTLRITRSKRVPSYYYRKNSSDLSGKYINSQNINLAKKTKSNNKFID